MHVFKKKIPASSFYTAYVDIINGILRLKRKECEVFSLMLHYSKELGTNGFITIGVRDAIMQATNMNPQMLSRYSKPLKEKRVIIHTSGGDWQINRSLMPTVEGDTCTVTVHITMSPDHTVV